MKRDELPDDIRRFILTSIPSVPYLEAMLLLRSEAASAWDAPGLARRLYVSDRHAAELLQALATAGIVQPQSGAQPQSVPSGRYSYHPATEELARRLDGVAQAYAIHLVVVTDLIHSRLDKRAQHFADAFRFRKGS